MYCKSNQQKIDLYMHAIVTKTGLAKPMLAEIYKGVVCMSSLYFYVLQE